jgi:hypothetical protein
MTRNTLRDAARSLAQVLRLPPQSGSVWTWVEEGEEEILVEIDAGVRREIPVSYHGFKVVVRSRMLLPTVRGIQSNS